MQGGLGRQDGHLRAVTLPSASVGCGPLTHMGGFFGSPWNFIFLEEFAAAGGARISLSSLCGDTGKGHAHPTPHPKYFYLPPHAISAWETEARLGSDVLTAHTWVRRRCSKVFVTTTLV